ncbi:transcriptional regulator [Sphaerisporangium melleum]|uniref:Transcriptional regulator n=1 Tax=Sphaerisporangium melleum TaxID=321316 RepID=A0A917QVC3_9ACTN|nr:Rrf2 family transcriptional regulator [Sphaerisporangium melleum]GGK71275.1 transcriptional regulator [Sphaerisporangium melleum]GII70193.1 transcriptional regulator [Sphaerisporangium melleum]
MSEGVEWAVHCCLTLAWLEDDRPVSTARLAAGYELPPAYLNKQLQALAKAGILTSTPGVKGGFRLARPLDKITLMDVVTAIEGPDEAFQCTEIRQRGMGAEGPERRFRVPCAVASAMHRAELAWRRALAAQTLADVRAEAEGHVPGLGEGIQRWYGRGASTPSPAAPAGSASAASRRPRASRTSGASGAPPATG